MMHEVITALSGDPISWPVLPITQRIPIITVMLKCWMSFPSMLSLTKWRCSQRNLQVNLYCFATKNGVSVICEIRRTSVFELERIPSSTFVSRIAWSEDEKLAATVIRWGRLSVRKISTYESKTLSPGRLI
ncbi:uncharacterized protein CIMG_07820 [Coccidioides immitis RS]|uniref:Uncharacterized protein n=1 Tax=Coccidioides immitis (strain RS) TaxID=246410 RepID=J3K472_COCIM|nr:uncharacterized protein CIMG_07820 [Coccidioides immitis RS]EAS29074.3 hypothetical protein CIMG_07820 [Coccidioides immitis RS]